MYKSTPTRFHLGYIPNSTASEIYEVTDDAANLLYISAFNSNATDELVEVYLVPSGETVGDEFKWAEFTISENETIEFSPNKPLMLGNGDKIYAKTTTADKVSVIASGNVLEVV